MLQPRRENEQAPDTVDDAWNAGEQFDRDADRAAQGRRAEFREKDRDPEPDGHGDRHRNQGSQQCAGNRRNGTENLANGIPVIDEEEGEPELAQRRQRAADQR